MAPYCRNDSAGQESVLLEVHAHTRAMRWHARSLVSFTTTEEPPPPPVLLLLELYEFDRPKVAAAFPSA